MKKKWLALFLKMYFNKEDTEIMLKYLRNPY